MKRGWGTAAKYFALSLALALANTAHAQIGGKTSADGSFLIDDAEDLDLSVESLGRDWVSDYVQFGSVRALSAIAVSGTGLTLQQGQSSAGILRFRVPAEFVYVNKSFGIPMPGQAGASTLDSPGNISSFQNLAFSAVYSPQLPNQDFMVILECYQPGGSIAKLYYDFQPALGSAFATVTIQLYEPSSAQNTGGYPVQTLLSRTRYLSFYCYAGPAAQNQVLLFYIDDIRLEGVTEPSFHAWTLY